MGSSLGAALANGSGLGFVDLTRSNYVALTNSNWTPLPNGWYDVSDAGAPPKNVTGFNGWGGFGDISYSSTLVGGSNAQNNDAMCIVMSDCAGVCLANVRLISQNWAPSHTAGNVTWNSGNSIWAPASGGPYNQSAWTSGKDANFDNQVQGTVSTVTVSGTIASVNSLNFNTDWRTLGSTAAGYQWIPTYTLIPDPANGGTIILTGDAVITAGAGTDQKSPDGNFSNVGGGCSLISCPIAGAAGLYKAGAGNLILTGANTYSGGTTVGGGTLMLGYGGTAAPLGGGTSGTIQGNVVNLANLAFNYSSAADVSVRTFTGQISGTGSVDVFGTGTTIFTNNHTYTGVTTIHANSALQIGNGGTSGAIVGDVVNNGTLVFNRSGSVTYSGTIYDGSAFFPANGSTNGYSYIYGGETAQPGNLIQMGPGKLTLDNSQMRYTGTTTVAGGALEITGASSSMAVFATAKTNVANGFLVLNYRANPSGQNGLVSTLQSLLRAGYNGGIHSFQPGYGYQLYSTAASNRIGLGWVDNAATYEVTIMPALYGDANLDGVVDASDLNTVLANYDLGGVSWSQGDFNYDGVVNFADLNKVLTNYHRTGPLNINDLPALAMESLLADGQAMQLLTGDGITISGAGAVPEPSSGVLLLFAVAAVLLFRRRLPRA